VSKSALEIAQGRAALIRKWCSEAGFDRKVMADLAVREPEAFGALVAQAKAALA
jgi:ribosomal protein L20